MSERPSVTACIVTWNTRDQVMRCVDALLHAGGADETEILVVDNASADGTAEAVRERYGPRVTLVANDRNLYYAAANNQAFAMARGEYVLILNPDAYVAEDCVALLIAALSRAPEAAAAAPTLILPDGSVQRSCRRFPSPWRLVCEGLFLRRLFPRTRLFGGYFYGEWDYATPREVEQPMTSCLLIRAEDLRACGGFDESFPMFFNDVDLCFRLAQRGRKVLFVPEARCDHDHGASTKQARPAMVRASTEGLLAFYRKHYKGRLVAPAYWACVALIRAGGGLRALLGR